VSGRTSKIAQVANAISDGGVAIIATDTVYGIVASAASDVAVERLYALKHRPRGVPVSLLCSDVVMLLKALPNLGSRQRAALELLLPGPYTFVVDDDASEFSGLRGDAGVRLGVRVPDLPPGAREVVARAGPLASSSANLHGGSDPSSIEELVSALAESVDAVIDEGVLPGTASTVVDITGVRPIVLRDGAVSEVEVVARLQPVFNT
jgi:L-threonylcarbamoyladenylate synthase